MLKRHDIFCLQEVRWKLQGAKMIGNSFKFLFSGVCNAETVWVYQLPVV